jgi:hypothetical protein
MVPVSGLSALRLDRTAFNLHPFHLYANTSLSPIGSSPDILAEEAGICPPVASARFEVARETTTRLHFGIADIALMHSSI